MPAGGDIEPSRGLAGRGCTRIGSVPRASKFGRHDSSETHAHEVAGLRESDLRVPGLTLLHHPDPRRVGERAVLLSLVASGVAELSRREPFFAPPGCAGRRPLEHLSISRRPIRLRRLEGGGLELDTADCSVPVLLGGEVVTGRTFAAEEVERGVVLSLGRHVALLLHRVDPVSVPNLPRYGLIGENPSIVDLRLAIRKVAELDVPVLVRGETGSGKELVGQAIHQASRRSAGPFVAVSLAAVPPTLAAAELFGSTRGAYTGAERRRPGLFVEADGGTLFLDEVGETPAEVQALLLRALETHEIRPVGGDSARRVDVRVVSATDTDLEAAIDGERFRAPLFYRLGGFELHVPPLRDRRDDVARLFLHFLCQELEALGASAELSTPPPWLDAALMARLVGHDWPGNVRQLRNVVRQLVISQRGEAGAPLPRAIEKILETSARPAEARPAEASGAGARGRGRKPSEIPDDELIEILRCHRFNLRATAAALGISRTSLYARIERCPGLRKAGDLELGEIEASLEAAGGDVGRAALDLGVSELALKRRLRQLERK